MGPDRVALPRRVFPPSHGVERRARRAVMARVCQAEDLSRFLAGSTSASLQTSVIFGTHWSTRSQKPCVDDGREYRTQSAQTRHTHRDRGGSYANLSRPHCPLLCGEFSHQRGGQLSSCICRAPFGATCVHFCPKFEPPLKVLSVVSGRCNSQVFLRRGSSQPARWPTGQSSPNTQAGLSARTLRGRRVVAYFLAYGVLVGVGCSLVPAAPRSLAASWSAPCKVVP